LSVNFFEESPKNIDEKIRKMKNDLKNDPDNIAKHFTFAELLLANQNKYRIRDAKESLNRVLQHKDHLEARILEIRAHRLSNNLPKALELAKQLDELNPDNPSILEELGRIYLGKKITKNALDYLKRAFTINPQDDRIGRAYILALEENNEYDEVLTLASRLVSISKNAKNIQTKAVALANLNRTEEAVSLLKDFEKDHPEEYKTKMWTLDRNYIPLSKNLLLFYFNLAYKKIPKGKYPNNHEFDKKGNISFSFNDTPEVKNYFEKALELCDKIILEINQNDDHEQIETIDLEEIKYQILFELHRFKESLHIIEKLLEKNHSDTNSYGQGVVNFFLKNFDVAVRCFEKSHRDYPTNKEFLEMLLDAYRAIGNDIKYRETEKKLNDLREKIKQKEKSNSNVKKSTKKQEFSIFAGIKNAFDNHIKVKEFFSSRKGGVLKIIDRHVTGQYIQLLRESLNMDEIHEVQIIRSLKHDEGGKQFFDECKGLPKDVYKFNKSFKDECKISIKVADLHADVHDRYAITNDEVYNIPGFNQMDKNQSSDGLPVTNEKGKMEKVKEFDDIWSSSESIILTQEKWTEILEKLSEAVKESKQEVHDVVKNEIHPTLPNEGVNKAVRDNVPKILESQDIHLDFEKLEDDKFIRKMHKKIQEELDEYIEAANFLDRIRNNQDEIVSFKKRLEDEGNNNPKLEKRIKKKEEELTSLRSSVKKEKHNDPLAEITDIIEAAYRMAELRGCSAKELDEIRRERELKFGKFKDNMYLKLEDS